MAQQSTKRQRLHQPHKSAPFFLHGKWVRFELSSDCSWVGPLCVSERKLWEPPLAEVFDHDRLEDLPCFSPLGRVDISQKQGRKIEHPVGISTTFSYCSFCVLSPFGFKHKLGECRTLPSPVSSRGVLSCYRFVWSCRGNRSRSWGH